MATTRMRKDGTVTIPADLRRRFGLDNGTLVVAEAREDGVLVKAVEREAPAADHRRRLLEETNRAYAALRSDPVVWEEVLAERAIWDVANLDGLDETESWSDEGERIATTAGPNDDASPR